MRFIEGVNFATILGMIARFLTIFGALLISSLFTQTALAVEEFEMPKKLYAQSNVDDSYDPFVDYSEFDEASEEEADINFFRNGRFFTLGFIGGRRFMTEGMRNVYKDAMGFGLFLSYFFDLRFALQISFLTGNHTIAFSSNGTNVNGDAALTSMGFNLKYYFNTQNVTKGLASLNPYIIGGFSQVYRTSQVNGQEAFAKEGALGFDFGLGIEIPMLRNKMYMGVQLGYQYVNFNDEQSEIFLAGETTGTGLFPNGDIAHALFILGVNF